MPSSRGSTQPRNQTHVSCSSCIADGFLTTEPPGKHKERYAAAAAAGKSLQSCPTLSDPMDCSTPGLPVYHQLPEATQTHVRRVSDAIQPSNNLILCHPLLFPPSIFPSIGIFSNESVLHIRWPKYSSFSFNISPMKAKF